MGKIHKWAKNHLYQEKILRSVVGENTYNQFHPVGTMVEQQYDATQAAEKAAKDAQNKASIPIPDEEELMRIRRRKAARRGGGRSSTILADETFG